MSEQWYCPNCGPEISVTVERIHTFSGPDDYIVCTGCGETVDEKAETPAFVLALQQRIATLEAAISEMTTDPCGENIVRFHAIDFNGNYGTEIVLPEGRYIRVSASPEEVKARLMRTVK